MHESSDGRITNSLKLRVIGYLERQESTGSQYCPVGMPLWTCLALQCINWPEQRLSRLMTFLKCNFQRLYFGGHITDTSPYCTPIYRAFTVARWKILLKINIEVIDVLNNSPMCQHSRGTCLPHVYVIKRATKGSVVFGKWMWNLPLNNSHFSLPLQPLTHYSFRS